MKNITRMTRDILFHWMIKNEPDIIKALDESNHTVEFDKPNIFHAEGSVKSHILMVMTWIEAKYGDSYLLDSEYSMVITAAMLHDIGKPECQETMPANETKPIRNSFKGHEGCSTFNSVGVLKKLQRDFPEIYSDELIKDIISLVSLHGTYIDENSDLYLYKKILREADKRGAIRLVSEEEFAQYEKRKYISRNKLKQDKHLVVLIGLPASGKSTLCEDYKSRGYSVLSRDDTIAKYILLESVQYRDDMDYNIMYDLIHKDDNELKKFNEFFEDCIRGLSRQDKVVIDMTMLSLSSRRKMLSKFPEHKADAVVVLTDNDTLKERAQNRPGKHIANYVYFDMKRSFVMPVKEEGFETINIIIN